MTDRYVRLSAPPQLQLQHATCSTCSTNIDYDLDRGWICPSCGTHWPKDATEDDDGMLYPDWSGEQLTGPIIDPWDWVARNRRRRTIEAELKAASHD